MKENDRSPFLTDSTGREHPLTDDVVTIGRAVEGFTHSVSGAPLWLLIVVLLSALASPGPALRAARLSVRESLAYA
jgi:hypothetical protein